MKTRLLILIPIIVGMAISLPLIISSTSGGTHFTQDIDPRFSEATRNGFAISSNLNIYSIMVEDEIQGISITTSSKTDGFIEMDDPLPILQNIFPEKNTQSFVVLSDGMEIAYELENGKMRISVNNSNVILIVGFAEI
jgi:hypothetical protein